MKVGDRVETPDGSHHDIIRITEDCGIQLSDCYFYYRSELKLVEIKPTNWYDYENMRMLKSPPVGEIVLVNTQSGERKAKVLEVTHNSTKEIFIVRVFNGSVEGVGDLNYKDEARPLDWDKLSNRNITVLHAMESVGNIHSCKVDLMALLNYLYDQDMLKLPEQK